jgi:hypothetical protein
MNILLPAIDLPHLIQIIEASARIGEKRVKEIVGS